MFVLFLFVCLCPTPALKEGTFDSPGISRADELHLGIWIPHPEVSQNKHAITEVMVITKSETNWTANVLKQDGKIQTGSK